jgi:hypothetical protein
MSALYVKQPSGGSAASTAAGGFMSSPWMTGGFKGATSLYGAVNSGLGMINTGKKRGLYDTLDPIHYLANGKTTGLGEGLSDAGVALTKTGIPIAMIGGAALKILGGLHNAGWGTKWNEELISNINSHINQARSTGNVFGKVNNSNEFFDTAGYMSGGVNFNNSDLGSTGWFRSNSKINNRANALRGSINSALGYQNHAMVDAANRVDYNNDSEIMRGYISAFGGPLGSLGYMDNNDNMGAIEYDINDRLLTLKEKDVANKSKLTNALTGASRMMALGGDTQTHGADWTSGLMEIGAGLSHEENPNDGVQLGRDNKGIPNLVEEGETVYDDYVYSNRIYADGGTLKKFHLPRKAKLTFAEISKKLGKEIKERENDPISQAGYKVQMHDLADEQERQKQEMEAERAKAAFEALSPEEQVAVMENAAQQEAMAEQVAMQQQAQLSQSPSDQVNQEYNLGQEPQMFATGGGIVKGEDGLIDYDKSLINLPEVVVTGKKRKPKTFDYAATPEAMQVLTALADIDKEKKQEEVMDALAEELKERKLDRQMYMRNRIHYYAKGGKMKENVYKLLNLDTDEKFKAWAKKHKLELQPYYYNDEQDYNWNALMNMQEFRDALAGDNKALKDALNKGYDFGAYVADNDGTKRYTWSDDFWGNINEYSKQKGNTEGKYKIDTSYKGNVKELEDSDKYKAFTNYILNGATDAERMKYFQWIDANTGRSNKYIKDGKLADNWRDMYQSARTDGLYGIQHYIPEMTELQRGSQAQNLLWNEETQSWNPIVGDVNPAYKSAGNFTWQDPQNNNTLNYYTDPTAVAEEPADAVKPEEVNNPAGNNNLAPKHRAEWLRYAGLFGPAVGLGMMAAGIGRPDTSGLDAALNAFDTSKGGVADYKPIGNYLTYRPMDIWYEQNRLNANARATDRALANNSSPFGSRAAGLLANAYNNQIASANLYRNALEYNDNQRKTVADFNRGTDQFNASAYNHAALANAQMRNHDRSARASLAMQAAQAKMDADVGWYNSLYGNVSGLFKGISDLGRENADRNWIARLAASGALPGIVPENAINAGLVKYASANGGKINKKKGKKGLTF